MADRLLAIVIVLSWPTVILALFLFATRTRRRGHRTAAVVCLFLSVVASHAWVYIGARSQFGREITLQTINEEYARGAHDMLRIVNLLAVPMLLSALALTILALKNADGGGVATTAAKDISNSAVAADAAKAPRG